MNKSIAFFDFDGTITTRDTLLEIIKFQKGRLKLAIGTFLLAPVLILYKLKIISGKAAKEQVLKFFFGNLSADTFQEKCDLFGMEILPGIVRPEAISTIQYHIRNGVRVIVVSASAENWITGWCRNASVEYIGTRLEISEGKLTGRIHGENCYGEEKVNRIKQFVNLDDYHEIYVYGDSKGDKAMLAIATHPFYRCFNYV